MLKRLEVTDPHSCLSSALEDEPVFVLRAHDPLAPQSVREWALRYQAMKKRADDYGEKQMDKFHEAMDLALAMEEWASAHGVERR